MTNINELKRGDNILVCGTFRTKVIRINSESGWVYFLNENSEEQFETIDAIELISSPEEKSEELIYQYKQDENVHFIINCQVYPFDLFCFFGPDKNIILDKLKYYLDNDIILQEDYAYLINNGIFDDDTVGHFLKSPNNLCILYVNTLPTNISKLAILNHEIYHTTVEILNGVGIFESSKSTEAFAYFNHFLHEEIYRNLGLQIKL